MVHNYDTASELLGFGSDVGDDDLIAAVGSGSHRPRSMRQRRSRASAPAAAAAVDTGFDPDRPQTAEVSDAQHVWSMERVSAALSPHPPHVLLYLTCLPAFASSQEKHRVAMYRRRMEELDSEDQARRKRSAAARAREAARDGT